MVFRVFLIGLRCYIRLKGGSTTSSGVTVRFRYFLSYFRVSKIGVRSSNVLMGGFLAVGDFGLMFLLPNQRSARFSTA